MTRWTPYPTAAVVAAALGPAQVTVAELAGITTLGGDFAAGNERVQGVQVTLIAWYCALTVPLAAAVAGARPGAGEGARKFAVLPAAIATLAVWPLLAWFSGDAVRDDVTSAMWTGILLGAAGALAVAVVPAIGRGLAAYAALLWVAALVCTALVPRTVVYAGMVQPLGLEFLVALRTEPYDLGYHLPSMLPVAAAVLVLAGAVSGATAHRTREWWTSVAAGMAGPVLTALLYRLTPDQAYLWNETAGSTVVALAFLSLPLTAATAAPFTFRRTV
ncbi:hypothetical protein [Spirillospora sp. NPDC048819]|uniref:hypothetical protein n=1 Tax=Spirillospora sp. NPDC048819 TaxID=3155268 RepID=UPI0034028F7C